MNSKILYYSLLCIVFSVCQSCRNKAENVSQIEEQFPLELNEIRIRDPFVLANTSDSTYYMHANNGESFVCYSSKDLRHWKECGVSFSPSNDFWGKQDFWAPKVYLYKGKYYLLATYYSDFYHRGISILVSDRPDSGYQPLTNEPLTPQGWMCLDGSLYIDKDGHPWVIYAREWIEVQIGEVYAQRLEDDLAHAIGDPVFLFKGSDADWPGLITTGSQTGIVTNAPFIYTTDSGTLLLIWSSFCKNGEYAMGVAYSPSGNLKGPWYHRHGSINDDGGHSMLFRDFDGSLLIAYHTNEPPVQVIIRPVSVQEEEIIFLN